MGRNFYGVSTVKSDAQIIADHGARYADNSPCWTSSTYSDDRCDQLPDGRWRCRATAHNQLGSCDGETKPNENKRKFEPSDRTANEGVDTDAKPDDYMQFS